MKFKSLSIVALTVLSSLFVACSEKPELTNEQKWHKFCESYAAASYFVMSDRQNNVEYDKAIEHVEKIPLGKEHNLMRALVEQAYTVQKYDQRSEKQQAMEAFKIGKFDYCMQQPH